MRTTVAENRQFGTFIGSKLNDCEGPVRFLLPEGGVSLLDASGQPFFDPEADEALVRHDRIRGRADRGPKGHPRSPPDQPSEVRGRGAQRLSRDRRSGIVTAPSRSECLARFREMIDRRVPIVGGGAGTGLSAKCEEAGGIDLIVIYNSGRYRMAGRGSLAGLLAYGNANEIVVDMAREVLPVVQARPGAGRRQCHRSVLHARGLPAGAQAAGFRRSAELPDGRTDRRCVPTEPGRDRHGLPARGRHDRRRPRPRSVDHAVRLRRGQCGGDDRGRRRHHRVPHGPHHGREHRRRHRAHARRLRRTDRPVRRGGPGRSARRDRAVPRRADRQSGGLGVRAAAGARHPWFLRGFEHGAAAHRAGADGADGEHSKRSDSTGTTNRRDDRQGE